MIAQRPRFAVARHTEGALVVTTTATPPFPSCGGGIARVCEVPLPNCFERRAVGPRLPPDLQGGVVCPPQHIEPLVVEEGEVAGDVL
eukprot:scaffold79996_cov93-Phaeocystis_antarctica.AAC.2